MNNKFKRLDIFTIAFLVVIIVIMFCALFSVVMQHQNDLATIQKQSHTISLQSEKIKKNEAQLSTLKTQLTDAQSKTAACTTQSAKYADAVKDVSNATVTYLTQIEAGNLNADIDLSTTQADMAAAKAITC